METQKWTLMSWNVGGLNGKHIVCDLLKTISPLPLVIGIQEFKTTYFLIVIAFNVIRLDYQRVIALPFERRGATLLYHPSLTLVSSSIMNHGRIAWAQLKLDTLIIFVVVVYTASDFPRECAYLWHQLKMKLPDGQWIIMGDFNMKKKQIDSSRPTSLLKGKKLEAWRLLSTRLDLIDAFMFPHKSVGTRFTHRVVHGHHMD